MTTPVKVRTSGLRIVAADDDTILDLDPIQGLWTEEQYLRLSEGSSRLLEFTDGSIEVPDVPTERHQAISQFLFLVLFPLVHRLGGTVLYAPLRLRVREGKFREPDLLLVLDESDPRRQNAYWLGADLVVEIVSPDDPERDTRVKRIDYAEAGIPEYWIVNPEDESITVLWLQGDLYVEHGTYHRGDAATSVLLPGFAVPVHDVFDAR
ncbi:MAG TPA: Uma2 family endonuclease [Chloroflexia bacterium]|jgi:Uma2 family endonuclease